MQLTDNDLLILGDFSDNTLDDFAKKELCERMESDADFGHEANLHLSFLKQLKAQRNTAIRERMKALDKKTQVKKEVLQPASQAKIIPFKSKKNWWLVGTAALAASLLTFFIIPKLSDNEKLAMSFLDSSPMERERAVNKQLSIDAMQAYLDKDYAKAAPLLDELFAQDKEDNIVLLYAGIAYLGEHKYDEAIIRLNSFAQSNHEDANDANWFLALAYTAKGDKIITKKHLDKILAKPLSPYFEKATSFSQIVN